MKLALVSCANGFGHLKRLIRILDQLIDRAPVKAVTLFCDAHAAQEINKWREYLLVRERCAIDVVPVWSPMRWDQNQEYYGEWVLDWHSTIPSWRLEDFDFVLSDNLVEPLLYSERVTLVGSFLWHDVLLSAFSGNQLIEKYSSWCNDILASTQPHVIANRYFATPVMDRQTNVHKVGLVHYCKARDTERINKLPEKVLIALGSAQAANGVADKLSRLVSWFDERGLEVFASSTLFERLAAECPRIKPFEFWDDNFDTIDLAVVRGGLGTISDCVAARVPMLYAGDPNPEIKFNQMRLSQMGIGLPLEKCLDESPEICTDPFSYRSMLSKMAGFDIQGHIEATNILAELWGFAPAASLSTNPA